MNSWFCTTSNPCKTSRLFCFPHAGGTAEYFHSWKSLFPDFIEVIPAQLPGRSLRFREKPFDNLTDLVKSLVENMISFLDRPFVFFGHSMGALIAFELTKHLEKLSYPLPKHLFLSGRSAPSKTKIKTLFHQLPDEKLLNKIQELNGSPKEALFHPELLQLLLPALRADLSICETYKYTQKKPLSIPLIIFGGKNDPLVEYESLDQWQRETTAITTIKTFPGNHFFLNQHRKTIAEIITGTIKDQHPNQ